MKKYKLIKEYPGSPKLGKIEKVPQFPKADNDELYFYITKYPKFWKEIIEKDYEILSFFANDENLIWVKAKDGRFDAKWQTYRPTEEDSLKEPGITIHSVKRLSDGKIFTIGDKIGTPGKTFPIANFKIYEFENTILVDSYYEKFKSGHYNQRLKDVIKLKQPLFTTEDSIDIFEGDIIYGVSNDWKVFSHFTDLQNKVKSWGIKPIFSSKEKAEEYIFMNKPCLSLNDLVNTKYWSSSGCVMNMLKELVKSKL